MSNDYDALSLSPSLSVKPPLYCCFCRTRMVPLSNACSATLSNTTTHHVQCCLADTYTHLSRKGGGVFVVSYCLSIRKRLSNPPSTTHMRCVCVRQSALHNRSTEHIRSVRQSTQQRFNRTIYNRSTEHSEAFDRAAITTVRQSTKIVQQSTKIVRLSTKIVRQSTTTVRQSIQKRSTEHHNRSTEH
jgi:hypothetical protein